MERAPRNQQSGGSALDPSHPKLVLKALAATQDVTSFSPALRLFSSTASDAASVYARISSITRPPRLIRTGWPAESGTEIAYLEWHYEDGTTASTPILYGTHVQDWIAKPSDPLPTQATLAWSRQVPDRSNIQRLYKTTWNNKGNEKMAEKGIWPGYDSGFKKNLDPYWVLYDNML